MNKENVYYVYLHRRLSDNEVFYVGKGKGKRAYSKAGRNSYWTNVVKKHGMIVEILFDKLNEQDSFCKEKLTISEFKMLGYPLVNLTEGGDGISGFRHSDDVKLAQSNKMKLEYSPEIAMKLAEGVREYYRNNKCIKPFSSMPWLHPNAPDDVWSNLDIIYQYYTNCSLTQSTLESVFDKSLTGVYRLFKSGFNPTLSVDWKNYKSSVSSTVLNENPRKAFWDIPLDCVFFNIEKIQELVISGKGYILIAKELGLTGCKTQRIVARIKAGNFSVSDAKYIFVKERLRVVNE